MDRENELERGGKGTNYPITRRLLGALALAGCLGFVISVPKILTAAAAQESSLPDKISPAARQVIDQMIEKLGGENFRRIRTLTTSGRFYNIAGGGTAGMLPFESKDAPPDKR
ncbi:MAG: hypothetical protein O7F56_07805, partial [Acidobacteria bacterium]|nr:hypothetical protein [Acidobacteriota bacterium]